LSATELVWGIQFSPDESKLAIGFAPLWDHDPRPRRVVIVDVAHPNEILDEFQLDSKSIGSWHSIVWSPSGKTLIVNDHLMFRLGRDPSCSLPPEYQFGGFLSEDRMVVYQRNRPDLKMAIQVLRPDCSLSRSWQTDNNGSVIDTLPDENLLAIEIFSKPSGNSLSSTIELVDSEGHEVKQLVKSEFLGTIRGGFLFADHGKAFCTSFLPDGRKEPDLVCLDTKTGTKIAENDKVTLDDPAFDGGGGGELLTITDYKYTYHEGKIWTFLDLDSTYSTAKRHLIWNFRTGREIASWGAPYQTELWGKDQSSAQKIRQLFAVSMSATGKYLAEAGVGSVSLYSVQP
jgi:hypothetical protein